ncbi:MAG TPA: serine/threonine-protein kinase [Polyangia bacterium]|nr:serine/threonine-protein kinase [Polyangia bacterium]
MSTPPRDSRHRVSQVGRYTIFNQIAAGSAVMVHLARFSGPAGFSRVVAVKRLHPRLAEDAGVRAIFLEEARRMSAVRHRNVVPTLDVVVNDTEVLQVMEHIQGATLGTLRSAAQRQQQEIPLDLCSAIVVGALQGLHAAHEARGQAGQPSPLVHAAVSPAQILVGIDGVARMVGFGDARTVRARSEINLNVPGDPTYLAPEQLRGEPVTRASDIFSAAVVLWELLTWRWLFGGVAEPERRYRLLQGAEVTPPSTIAPRLPRGLDEVVMHGLRPNPTERYRTALDMAAALERAIPPATQGVVGEWVIRTAAEALAEEAELLKQIEVSAASAPAILSGELDGPVAAAPDLVRDPPSGPDLMSLQIMAKPTIPLWRDRRALVIGGVGATIFAGLLAMSHRANLGGSFALPQFPPAPLATSAGRPEPMGTTVIMKDPPAPAPTVPAAVVPLSRDQARLAASPDAAAAAIGPPAPAPAAELPRAPEPPPGPVLSRDTTLDTPAPSGRPGRDRRPARKNAAQRTTRRHGPVPAEAPDQEPAPAVESEAN